MQSSIERHNDNGWRTLIAIGLAGSVGTVVGVGFRITPQAAGNPSAGLLAVIMSAVVVPSVLCWVASRSRSMVRLCFAAGAAAGQGVGLVFSQVVAGLRTAGGLVARPVSRSGTTGRIRAGPAEGSRAADDDIGWIGR